VLASDLLNRIQHPGNHQNVDEQDKAAFREHKNCNLLQLPNIISRTDAILPLITVNKCEPKKCPCTVQIHHYHNVNQGTA
jgi:hypothetical protein